ncbi:bifunctional 4-hydroxy-2-oxoglutarate aldolase/2-dehydro-3-deoxy-phosphogluconate aldolase [Geobacillus subterraneus]|uniref:bifunctional 4-hydroxy-2-oxoglutarate aldolase/2-dehydro-3-deoxy-phosphogluconate aldolase n=1 Tax=Geobacillus subterraneus TaxID=129338 RepID=UPI00067B94A5|nr:bifunctional 4-hydroxy-2-oxoglutarate aldolase/2-dehydro-3-deoxy-phosphogluconate aldolase [Geobacillus subterraneus]AKU25407.1 2-dehydro-3-deoxyphosphogluconate aldolase [Geobacillus sp. LC300]KZM58866.1 2-dehydro-3-deoxyphosphogluconate aldolase [Geobacillus stearothermophilus]WPZ16946.1 bifunctional 4-hydroxy-2-oxoglutarate aldolase/2-dehydro-3-deoxy-phosphogluconate aldolase [Geobacillus subterraneus]
MDLLGQIKENGIVAIIRNASPTNILPIVRSLRAGGVKTVEITVETPKVLTLIEKVIDEMGNELIVGAGTVLDPETARAAIMAGAKFIFSPTVNVETIKLTKRYGVISIPGALTPTEILTAYEHGADVIKVFPANVFGPGYLKDIHGPMPHVPLMPTGGLNLGNIADYIKAGAVAVGLGNSLVNTKMLVSESDFENLRERAEKYVQEVKKARTLK